MFNSIKNINVLLGGLILLLVGCKSDETIKEPEDFIIASDYFPSTVGTFRKYQVQSDTTFYEITEEIVGDTIVGNKIYHLLKSLGSYSLCRYDSTNLYYFNQYDTVDQEDIALKVNQQTGTTWTEWSVFNPSPDREVVLTIVANNSTRMVNDRLFSEVIELSVEIIQHWANKPPSRAGIWHQWYAKDIGLIEVSEPEFGTYSQKLIEWNIVK